MAEKWEILCDTAGVWTDETCRITTDTLLLAWFARPEKGETCADLGTGCGAIPVLWRARYRPGAILAVELRRDAAELAARSAEKNGFTAGIRVVCGDVREHRTLFPPRSLGLIACNPPYFPLGSGAVSRGSGESVRHDGTLTLQDLADAAGYGLEWGGRLCVCLRTERLAEAMEVFRRKGLEPKRLILVQSRPDKAPYLFLLECRRGGKTGLTAEPALILTDGEGKYTPQAREVYWQYRK